MAMLTTDRYARTSAGIQWSVPGTFETTFRWEYQDGRDSLLKLYAKGKERQWDADTRIDWSQDLDPENPEQLPDESIPIFGSPPFERLTARGEGDAATALPVVAALAVPARRAGRAHLHGEDRAAGAEHGRQVLRRDAGDRRGAPRRGVLAAAARQVRARVSDHADAPAPARRRAERLALGHDVPRHAGPDRGPRARRLRVDSRPVAESARGRGERLRHAGRGASRRLRPLRAARLLPDAHPGRARRARGVRGRGVLPDARPLPGRGGVGDARPARSTSARRTCSSRASCRTTARRSSAASSRDQGHRALGAEDPQAATSRWASSATPTSTPRP